MLRTSWVKFNGITYQPQDYVIIGWQDNDLHLFARILEVHIANNTIFFKVVSLITEGIESHFHSFVINNCVDESLLVQTEELVTSQVYTANLCKGSLYITFHTHIEKT